MASGNRFRDIHATKRSNWRAKVRVRFIGSDKRVLLRHYLEQGMSKAAVARQLGVSRRTVYYWIKTGQLNRGGKEETVQYGPRPLAHGSRSTRPRRPSCAGSMICRGGLAMNALARRLNAEGWRPRHAEFWPISTVAVILGNEVYVGRTVYLKTTSTGRRAQPHGSAPNRVSSALDQAHHASPPRMDRIARPRHPRRDDLCASAATPGGQPETIRDPN